MPRTPSPGTARPRRRVPRPLSVLGLLLAVVLACGLTACSGPASVQTGDCVERSDDTYLSANCATAELRVLERQDDLSARCETVAGVTEGYTDYSSGYRLCLGPRDTDPATAVNVAQAGACLAGIEASTGQAGSDVHQVDCGDPSAGAQVLSREEDAFSIGDECVDTPGSTASYSWTLKETGEGAMPQIGTDILFCLGPVGVDPQSSPDTAQVGDCLRDAGGEVDYAKVDCGAPDAVYRVVERVDNAFMSVDLACADVPGATYGVQRQLGLVDGYVLCLAPV